MQVQADAKSRIMETWLRGIDKIGDYIIKGDMVRLFASEVNNQGDNNKGLQTQLVAQLPYMRQMIREFIAQHNLQDAFMVNQKGHVYLAGNSKSGMLLTPSQEAGVKSAFATQKTQFLPIRQVGAEYILEIVRPIMALDNVDQKVVSAFLMMLPIKNPLSKIMRPGNFDRDGEKGYLLQTVGNKTWHINLDGTVSLKPINFRKQYSKNTVNSPIHGKDVFVSTSAIDGTYLVSLYEYSKDAALNTIQNFKKTIYTFIGLGMLTVIAILIAIIWYMLGQRNRHRVKSQEQAIDALVRTVEIRDPYLSGHHQRVAQLALEMSNKMNMAVEDRSTLYYAALLSGVGKIFVPQNILTKPGKLTDEERKTMENHVNHALNILGDIDFEFPIAAVIHQMHERSDGSGYPNKMTGDDINRLSRLLGVCDVFCALTSPRSYRTRKSEEEALKLMLEEKSKYDVVMLATLKKVYTKIKSK
jgi:HD-GYP domain-containing protein (c-di-GMP phosphodiesterase class II)